METKFVEALMEESLKDIDGGEFTEEELTGLLSLVNGVNEETIEKRNGKVIDLRNVAEEAPKKVAQKVKQDKKVNDKEDTPKKAKQEQKYSFDFPYLQLEVSEDKSNVYLTIKEGVNPLPSIDDVVKYIQEQGIKVDIKRDTIEEVFIIYEKRPSEKKMIVAEETRPIRGKNAKVKYNFLDKVKDERDGEDKEKKDGEDNKKDESNLEKTIFEKSVFQECSEFAKIWPSKYDSTFTPIVKQVYVEKDELLAEKVPEIEGTPGFDVFGNELYVNERLEENVVKSSVEMTIDHDKNTIELRDKKRKAYAKVGGYIAMAPPGNVLKIIPPVLITEDNTQAYFIRFPGQPNFSKEEIKQWLEHLKVRSGVLEDNIKKIVDGDIGGNGNVEDPSVLIAQGTPRQDGKDAEMVFSFVEKLKPGDFREDGTFDFRKRREYKCFNPKETIARKRPPSLGIAGENIFGKTLKAKNGKDIQVVTKANVAQKNLNDGTEFISEIVGEADVKQDDNKYSLSVHKILHQESIDLETGDIDYFNGNIEIDGDINEGHIVRAEGRILVHGSVLRGAIVEAGGDIIVEKAIYGKDINIKSGGDVVTRFIQGARASANGNILIGSGVFHSYLESGDTITCLGRTSKLKTGKKGSIIGSRLYAVNGIDALVIGADNDRNTHLTLGQMSVEQLQSWDNYKKYITNVESYVKALRVLFGGDPSPVQVLDYIRKKKPHHGKVSNWFKHIRNLEQNIHPKMKRMKEDLEKKLNKYDPFIKVELLYPDVRIEFVPYPSITTDNLDKKIRYGMDHEEKAIKLL